LVEPWVTTLATIAERDVVLVRVVFDDVEGWGECVAQPDPTYSPEYVESAIDVLARHLVPRLAAGQPRHADDVARILAPVKGHAMAKAALEAAILDAQLRAQGISLADDLWRRATASDLDARPGGPTGGAGEVPALGSDAGGVRGRAGRGRALGSDAGGVRGRAGRGLDLGPRPDRVAGGVAVGVTSDVGRLLDEVARRVEEGYRRVKLKVHPGWDVEPVSAVRHAHPDLALQVDANGAYAAQAPELRRQALGALDTFALLLIEQPLADDDLLGHAELASQLRTPICLDETITSLAVAETALALGACGVVNIKAGRVGGYLEAVRIHDRCFAGGIPVWCGGMLETGIGRAANVALAALPGFTLPGDLSASGRFWVDDVVTEPAVLQPDGTLLVPTGPGTGVEVRDLAPWTVTRQRLL
jgi:O-succinylbenzoate synthase